MFLDTDRQMAHTWLLVYISIRIFPQSTFLFFFLFLKKKKRLVCACTKMSGHAGSSKESSYVLLYAFLLPCVIFIIFPCLLGISFIFQFFLVWGKTWAVLHLSPTKLFISCSLNNTDETEGGQNTSSKDTSHVHTSSAIQKEAIHFEYVVNTFESSLLSMFVVISV